MILLFFPQIFLPVDILENIIQSLSSDEVRRFKILSNRFKADEEKKLLVLFDAIRAGDFKEQEATLVEQIYGTTGARAKNSYYRLRNKLLSNLEKSLLFYHFNYKNTLEAFADLQLALLYRERGLYREALYSLKKAEKAAADHHQFSALEVIYDEMVQLASYEEVDMESLLDRRRANLTKVEVLRGNSEVLGMITQQLMRRNYSRSKRSESVIEMLEGVKARLEEQGDIFQSPSGKRLILKTVVSILLQKSAYQELVDYVEEMYQDFEANGLFSQDTHHTRLMMRIWRINSLQKLLKLGEAAAHIHAFWEELQMYDRQQFQEMAFYYYAPKAYNLKLQGELSASGAVLEDAFRQRKLFRKNELQELYLLISLADQRFCEQAYEEALDVLEQVKRHPRFSKLDEEMRFFIHIFELVTLYEAGSHVAAERANKALRKAYRSFFRDDFYAKAHRFVELIMRLNTAALEDKRVFLKSAYKSFVEEFPPSEIGDNQVILYETYLAAKLSPGKSYYELLCERVGEGE
jgi:hypothetical protein